MTSPLSLPAEGLVVRDAVVDDVYRGLTKCLTALAPLGLATYGHLIMAMNKRKRRGIKTFVGYLPSHGIVGTASLFLENKLVRDCGVVGHIEDVAIHPDHQGQGIGKALVEHIIQLCRKAGCYKVILACRPEVVPFYAKVGFYVHEQEMRLDLGTTTENVSGG